MGISFDKQYPSSMYDGTIVPPSGPIVGIDTFDYGLNLGDPFDPNSSMPPPTNCSPATVASENDLSLEFYRLQTAYFEAQLALSQEAQHMAEAQAPFEFNNPLNTQLPLGGATYQKGNYPYGSLPLSSDDIDETSARPEQVAPEPQVARTTPIKHEGLPMVGKCNTPGSSDNMKRPPPKRSPDTIPLYNPGGAEAEAAVSSSGIWRMI
ncbi:hypothetical protein NPX13_g270 [Xylaria arbuscula]|uniref:Uncharacterized protein n=1 Tax=Xylaria arbuscula TaxID=114810 RepID=A0A9W8NNU4_9PEZI|nr:hypothetical protein NPX13_g270 [Xylaria arbuscula]